MNRPFDAASAASDNRITLSPEDELAVLRARVDELERESAERKRMDHALKALAFGTATATGQECLQQLVRQLSASLEVPCVFVTEFVPGSTDRVRTVAGWCQGKAADSVEYALQNSPCENVFRDGLVFLPRHVRQHFPQDEYLIALNIESYMGVPLLNGAGRATGHLCVMDVRPFGFDRGQGAAILSAFAERAAAELERLRAEETLKQSEERFRALYENNPTMYFTLTPDGTILSVNRFGAEELGYGSEELAGRSVLQVFQPADHHTVLNQLTLCAQDPGRTFDWEIQKVRKTGTLLWVKERARAIIGPDRTPIILIVCEDITEQRQAKAAHIHSQERLRSFLNALDDLAFELDAQGTYLNVWTRNEDTLLLPKQDILGKSLTDIHGQEDGARYNDVLTRVLRSGQPETIEYALTLRGQLRYFSAILSRIPASATTSATVACVVRETTTQKRSAEALRLSEQHVKSIIETSPECVKLVAADGTLLQINAAGLAMIEADDVQNALGRCIYPMIAEPHRDAFRAMNERVCGGRKESLEFEIVGQRGTRRWMETHAVPLRNPADGTMAQLAITRDITDRKQAELALRQSEQRFEIAFRSSPHPVLITELATGRCLEVNDTALQLFGFQRHEAVGHTTIAIELWPKPEDRTRFITKLLESGTLRSVEFSFQTKDHRLRHCLISSELIELNGTQCILTVGTDVTEKKEAEAALRESEERWQRFVADAPIGLVVVDADKHILSANKSFCTLTGYSEQEVINNTYALYTHPDDLPKNLELTDEFFAGRRQEYTYEKRYVRKDGEIIWVSIRANRLSVHGHDTPLLLAVVEDITDRKQALADRERISQDLHDNILQSLYAVGMQLEAGKLLSGKAPRKSKQHVTQAIRQLNHLVLEVRQFIVGLTRRAAPSLDFGVAFKQLVASFSSDHHAAPALNIDPQVIAAITPAVGEQLLNITREALSNSVRHTTAAHRSVALTATDTHVSLRITDDGTGFDTSRKRRRGHGLANMAARARTIRAQFTLDSAHGQGTCITIDVPTGGPHVR